MKIMRVALMVLGMSLVSNVWAAEQKVDVTVDGMVCSFCAQGITKKFKARPEVSSVDVKLSDQKVYLSLKDGQDISDDDIRNTLKKAGYSVEKIERKPS